MKKYIVEFWQEERRNIDTLKEAEIEKHQLQEIYGDKIRDIIIIEVETIEKKL